MMLSLCEKWGKVSVMAKGARCSATPLFRLLSYYQALLAISNRNSANITFAII
nr:MAG TPA: hypothetical protein [Caudoviricetes sp.]